MSKTKDLTGLKFGRLLVVKKLKIEPKRIHWECLCDCGNKTIVETSQLKRGRTQSCGCLAREKTSQRCLSDLTGQRFGKLTVIKKSSQIGEPVKWECLCDCGNTTFVTTRNLKKGNTKSCGCLKLKHGLTQTRIYRIWKDMKQRCYNPNNKFYNNYGGRGIKICNEWYNDVNVFYNWAVNNGYNDSLEIDRINNNCGYSPENCRWITHQEQQYNKRSNRLVEYNGELKPLMTWVKELGLDYHKVNLRLLNGWSVEDAFWSNGKEHFKKYCNNSHQNKPVIQYDLDMNFVKIYDSIKEAAQTINGNQSSISRCCYHKQKQYKDFIWRFKETMEDNI